MIDDVGWADFGYNNKIRGVVGDTYTHPGAIPTPNIDRLVENGLKLTSHYVHPTCTPSRFAIYMIVELYQESNQYISFYPQLLPKDTKSIAFQIFFNDWKIFI